MNLAPITLEGTCVRLEPLALGHHAALWEVALDPELWRWTTATVETPEDLRRYVEAALREQELGRALPFATLERRSGRVVGSTRFGSIEPAHRKVEIGWTWIGRAWQRTALNTEAKYLMMRHAFETWGCMRVELKTSSTNLKSQAAMRRLGLVQEGLFRKWMFNENGTPRDTMFFSCIEEEWPAMKARLEGMLAR